MKLFIILVMLFSFLAVSCSSSDASNGEPSVFRLSVGDCFDDPLGQSPDNFMRVQPVDCDVAHDNEVTGIISVFFEEHNNNVAEIEFWSSEACIDQLEAYVGAPYNDTFYVSSPLYEHRSLGGYVLSEEFLGSPDPRDVLCFLFDEEMNPLTGSARVSD